MSYQRLYPQRINWEDEPSLATPINQVNLNKMDSALYGIDGRVVELDENKVGKSDTFNTARNGVVPKPTQADITNEKVLRADGSWVEQSGGGGGGGGHTIVNNAGTSLTQRSKLKTVGGLNATDDGVNNTTEITDVVEEVPWATWQGYPSEEAALQAHPNCVVTGAPDCDGDVEIENMHLVWSNPSPTSDYGAQQITLNIGDYGTYDKIRVEAHLGKSDNRSVYTEFDISDSSACLRYEYTGATNISVRRRDITNDGNNQITFGGAYFQVAGQTLLSDNSQLIPMRVYVYKKKLTAKIQAIARNVSTEASKCMLDENTSVADVLANQPAYSGISNITAEVKNGVLIVDFSNTQGATANSWNSKGVLPAGYRPSRSVYGTATEINGTTALIYVSSAGEIQIRPKTANAGYYGQIVCSV